MKTTNCWLLAVAVTAACSDATETSEPAGAETTSTGSGSGSGSDGSTAAGPTTLVESTSTGDLDSSSDTTADGEEACPNLLRDGGFEDGLRGDAWSTDSVLLRTPLCNQACLDGAQSDAHLGSWWLWFGGQEQGESAHASQVVSVPAGDPVVLSFQLRIPTAAGTGDDILAVVIDGRSRMWISDTDVRSYTDYAEVTLDLPELADGGDHEIGFAANFPGTGVTSFYVDTVRLARCTVAGR